MQRLRLRHDGGRLGRIALARQRAARLLGLGRRRRARQLELCRASRARRSIRSSIWSIHAPDRASLVASTHALDRVLLQAITSFRTGTSPISASRCWDKFGQPRTPPPYALAASTPGGSIPRASKTSRRRSSRCRRSDRAPRSDRSCDARLRRPPHPADRPDAVRDHPGQFRHRAGGAGRAGRPAHRPAQGHRGRHAGSASRAAAASCRQRTSPSQSRGARGLDPEFIKRDREALRLRQAAGRALLADDQELSAASISATASSATGR